MDIVRIDFFKNGLKIYMDPEASFKDIRYELIKKLEPVKKFLKDATAAIKIEGRILNGDEEKALYEIVSNHTDFNIACIFYDDEESIKVFEKIIKVAHEKPVSDYVEISRISEAGSKTFSNKDNNDSDEYINPSDASKQQDLRKITESVNYNDSDNLVIYGDVEKGETIVSEKSIYIMGALNGEAYAGIKTKNSSGDDSAIIFALDFNPEQIGIASEIIKPKPITHIGLGGKNKYNPVICYLKNGVIKCTPLTKDLAYLIKK